MAAERRPWAKVHAALRALPAAKQRFVRGNFQGRTADTAEPCGCAVSNLAEHLGITIEARFLIAHVEVHLDVPSEVVRELITVNDRAPCDDTAKGCDARYWHVRDECARRALKEETTT